MAVALGDGPTIVPFLSGPGRAYSSAMPTAFPDFAAHGAQRFDGVLGSDILQLEDALSTVRTGSVGVRLHGLKALDTLLGSRGCIGAIAASVLGQGAKAHLAARSRTFFVRPPSATTDFQTRNAGILRFTFTVRGNQLASFQAFFKRRE